MPYTSELILGGAWTATLPGVSSLYAYSCSSGFYQAWTPTILFSYPPALNPVSTGSALFEWDTPPGAAAVPPVSGFPSTRWLAEGGNLLPQYFAGSDGAGGVTYVNAATLSSAPYGASSWPGAEVTVLQWSPPLCSGSPSGLGAPAVARLAVPLANASDPTRQPVPATEITPLILDPYLVR